MFILVSAFVNRYRITSGYLSGIERDQVLSNISRSYMFDTKERNYNLFLTFFIFDNIVKKELINM